MDQPDGRGSLVDVLAAGAGGTVYLHLIVLGTDLKILGLIGDLRNDLDGREGGLTAGIGVKGRHPDQPMDTVFTFQEAIGIFAGNHDGSGLDTGLVALLIVEDLVCKAVALRPAGVHPIKHLAPILGLSAAGAGLKAHDRIVSVILACEQGLQTAGFHILRQLLIPFLQLLQHGVVILFRRHFADGHEIVPVRQHFFVPLDFCLRLPGLHHDLLALLRVVPEARGLLHGVEPLQLAAQALHVQRIRKALQCGAAVVEFLLIHVKFNIHSHTLSFRQITDTQYTKKF